MRGKEPQEENAKQETSGKQTIIMVIIALVCVLIIAEVGYAIVKLTMGSNTEETWLSKDVDDKKKKKSDTENVSDVEEGTEELVDEEELIVTDVSELLEEGTLMVCVPADHMYLRKKPGLNSDIIAELSAGQQVIGDGTRMEQDGCMFYRVVVRQTGQRGYVAADYCVKVDFDPTDLDALSLVETDTALYTYDMMVEDIQTLAQQYPDRVSFSVRGTSLDGRDIYEVVLGNADAQNHIMTQAGIHGREYMTSQLLMKMIEYYCYYYDMGSYHGVSYRELFDQTAIHIVPMSNPDGVTISQLGASALNNTYYQDIVYECYERDKEYMVYEEDANGYGNWSDHYSEKDFDRNKVDNPRMITYQEYQQIWKANAAGVDLNNNFDAGWDGIDLKEYPSYGNYKGVAAVSEPETRILADMALQGDYQYFISYHSKGQLIYYDVEGNDEDTSARSLELANMLQDSLKYKPVSTKKAYHVNLGGFSDWIQLSLNQASVTVESGKMPCPLSIEEFPGMWYRHRESWAMLMEELYK